MATPKFEKIRDDQQFLQLESPVCTYVPIVSGGNTRMPFDDGINGNAFIEVDKGTGTITLELYKGLPIADPAKCGSRQSWRAQVIGSPESPTIYERSKGSDGNNCYDRSAHRPNLNEFTFSLPDEIKHRVLTAFAQIDPNTPSAQHTDFWKMRKN